MGERLRRVLVLESLHGYRWNGGEAAKNPVTWFWRAWLSLNWGGGGGCAEPCYHVLESLVIPGMREQLHRTLLPGLREPGYRFHGGDAAQNLVTWFWRAWLSLEWGRDMQNPVTWSWRACLFLEWGRDMHIAEPCYLVLESLVIAGMGEWLRRTLLPGLGEPGYRWNGGETA
jgi:hypothetical protein